MTSRKLIDPQHAVLILNPVSGTKDPVGRREEILAAAEKYGWKGELVETTKKITAAHITARFLKKGTTHFVACGGDGTIMEVVDAAVGKDCVIGVVPLGTGNLFAQNLYLPLDIEDAMKVALTGKVREIDIGKANDTYFTIMAGIGYDAEIMQGTKREVKEKLGFIAYGITALRKFRKSPGIYEVTVDDESPRTVRAKSILVANMGRIQGGIKAVPKASPENGTLQVGIIQATSIWKWLDVIYHAVRGNVNKSEHYTLLKGKDIRIIVKNDPKRYELDGNEFPPTDRLDVTILPSAIRIITVG